MLAIAMNPLEPVPVRALNQAVRRNPKRFPGEFVSQPSKTETGRASLRSQNAILKPGRGEDRKYAQCAFTTLLAALLLLGIVPLRAADPADSKRPSSIQWKPCDCSSPLMLPKGQYDASQFGKGMYRIDNIESHGHFNCIYIIFQSGNSLEPAAVPGAVESAFTIKGQKVVWRSYKTTVEGQPVIRKEALMPNILPHQKQGAGSDYVWIRMDADSQQILDKLTPIAEGMIRDAAP